MLTKSVLLAALATESVLAFPFVPNVPGVDSSLLQLGKRQQSPNPGQPGSLKTCPVNPNHKPAAPVTKKYPYNGAINGKKGMGKGGFRVPAVGDEAHRFIAPDYSTDVRGPCPGLNTMANHNFLARDGITTFDELVDAQQNVYNVGFDLANLLAVLGLTTTDGDIVTEKLSIGCNATPRTSFNPKLTGYEPGLDGHNKFEADTSLTRDDYFTSKPKAGDNFSFNGTLFGMMTKTTKGNYNFDNLALYRKQRYEQSIAENPNFYFGPLSLLLFGAASFLYELMPSGTRNYKPDYYTISHFFGAKKVGKDKYEFTGKERLPDNWTNRVDPYDNEKVGAQIFEMYFKHPVPFGGNTGDGQFDVISHGSIKNGTLTAPDAASVTCLLLQLTTERFPSSLNGFVTPTVDAVSFALSKLLPSLKNFGCAIPLT